ncbi:hypothetical protein Tco_1171266 [Tanacetum coccineum]
MAGVYISYFKDANLRLPLPPFFNKILKHYRMHIWARQRIRKWQKKFFFVNLKHDMDMRTNFVIDPEKEIYSEKDAELLSRYTFKIGSCLRRSCGKQVLVFLRVHVTRTPLYALDVKG